MSAASRNAGYQRAYRRRRKEERQSYVSDIQQLQQDMEILRKMVAQSYVRQIEQLQQDNEILRKMVAELQPRTAKKMVNPRARVDSDSLDSESPGKEDYSEADASGAPSAPPPYDPVKDMFDRGVALIGGPPAKARSLIGKFRKQHGDVVVLDAIVAAEAEGPMEPVPWLVKRLHWEQERVNGRPHKLSRNDSLFAAFAAAAEGDRRFAGAADEPLLEGRR